jgi:ribosomal protein S18 acetylase RimI-like enzyme
MVENIGFEIVPIRGTAEELAEILEVYRQCEDFLALGPVPIASMEMVLADLALSVEEGGTYYGIYPPGGGKMMGVVDFVLAGFEGDPQMAFLSLLMIAVPYRAQGLGAKVAQEVEERIRRDGRARAIHSGVQVNNPAAIRFWQRMGYHIISGAEDMPDGTTVYQVLKELD